MAYTKDQARAQVEALVANFRANEASLADVPTIKLRTTKYAHRQRQTLIDLPATEFAIGEKGS